MTEEARITRDRLTVAGPGDSLQRARPFKVVAGLAAVTDRFVVAVCGVLFLTLLAVIVVAVVFRYVLNDSLSWSVDLVRYLAAWLVFLGMSAAHRRGDHVAVTALLGRLPRRRLRAGVRVVEAMTVLIALLIAWLGWLITAQNFERHQVTPALQIDIAWAYLAIPVGFGITALHGLIRVLNPVTDIGRHEPQGDA